MTLLASRLNASRYTSILADLAIWLPTASGLQGSETAYATTFRQNLAHSIADHEGTDVVAEFTVNATVPVPNITTGVQTATGSIT